MLDPNLPEDIASLEKTRQIVKEVLDFGVSQKEILKIIHLLSYELEDRNIMVEIHNCLFKEKNIEEKKESLLV